MLNSVNVQVEKLQAIVKDNATSEAVLFDLAMRERNTAETLFGRHKGQLRREGFNIDDQDYWNVMKKLEQLGFGSIISGRLGKDTRFKWHYSLCKVGAMAYGTNVEKTEADRKKLEYIASKLVNPAYKKRPVGRPKKQLKSKIQLNSTVKETVVAKVFPKKTPKIIQEAKSICVVINNKLVGMDIPSNLNSQDLDALTMAIKSFVKSA